MQKVKCRVRAKFSFLNDFQRAENADGDSVLVVGVTGGACLSREITTKFLLKTFERSWSVNG